MATKGVVRAASYSMSIAAAAAGTPQRGSVHSVFAAAANIVFPGESVLSLNALDGPQMPNGLQLSVSAGAFPFAALHPGMPVLFGAQRLHIEAIECSIDLSTCPRWDPHIYHTSKLDRQVLNSNGKRLAAIWNDANVDNGEKGAGKGDAMGAGGRGGGGEKGAGELMPLPTTMRIDSWLVGASAPLRPSPYSPLRLLRYHTPLRPSRHYSPPRLSPPRPFYTDHIDSQDIHHVDNQDIRLIAQSLCGRGVGLTPSGDDVLAGWMAVGWLLYGTSPNFLRACQQIMEVAQLQTHVLSRCWLGYAAGGDVALPIVALLEALARDRENEAQLVQAAQAVLAMGATSGYDVITGNLLGLNMYLDIATPC